jgi:hypothetical protein
MTEWACRCRSGQASAGVASSLVKCRRTHGAPQAALSTCAEAQLTDRRRTEKGAPRCGPVLRVASGAQLVCGTRTWAGTITQCSSGTCGHSIKGFYTSSFSYAKRSTGCTSHVASTYHGHAGGHTRAASHVHNQVSSQALTASGSVWGAQPALVA